MKEVNIFRTSYLKFYGDISLLCLSYLGRDPFDTLVFNKGKDDLVISKYTNLTDIFPNLQPLTPY